MTTSQLRSLRAYWSTRKLDTATIANLMRLSEAEVYNALARARQ